MVGWHHQLDGHEFEQVPGDGEGQGSMVCWFSKDKDALYYLYSFFKESV